MRSHPPRDRPPGVSGPAAPASRWRWLGLVFLAASTLNLLWLWDAPLADTTEARHAEIGREFAEGGRWLIPTLNYRPHLTKPPLADWLVAAGIGIFGANEFGARFFGALVAALGLALVAGLAERLGGRRAGLAAAAFYFVTPIYLALGRTISIDILLATLVTGACWCAWQASREGCPRPRSTILLYWTLLGLGALAKGHIILLLAFLPVVAWILWRRRWRLARRLFWPPALCAFAAIALPWYAYIASVFPEWPGAMVANELGQRTVGAEFGDANFGLSVLYFLGGALFCLPFAILGLLRPRHPGPAGDRGERQVQQPPEVRDAIELLALSIGVPLVVFSAVSSQRVNYVAPLVPAAAILAGLGWSELCATWNTAGAGRRACAYLALLGTFLLAPATLVACLSIEHIGPWSMAAMVTGAGLLATATAAAALLLRRQRTAAATRCVLVCAPALWLASLGATGAIKRHRSTRAACRQLAAEGVTDPFCFESYFASAQFYLGDSLRLCEVNPDGFAWPAGRRAPRRGLAFLAHRDIYGESRKPAGCWLLLEDTSLESLERFAAGKKMSLGPRRPTGKYLAIRARTRPPAVAPRPRKRKPPGQPAKQNGAPPPQEAGPQVERLSAGLKSTDPLQRQAAALGLESLGARARPAVPLLMTAARDEDSRVRAAAIRALGSASAGSASLERLILAAAGDESELVRTEALRVIGRHGPASEPVKAAVVRAMRDESPRTRGEASAALPALGLKAERARSLLLEAIADRSAIVRYNAARSLGRIGDAAAESLAALRRCLSDSDWLVRRYAASSLGQVGATDDESIAALTAALADEDWEVRRCAARSLGWAGRATDRTVAGLAGLLDDDYWQARMYAAQSLGRLGPEAGSALPGLKRALQDPEPQVRAAVRNAIDLVGNTKR